MQLLTVAMVPLQHITVGWYVTGCSSLLRNITWTQKQMDNNNNGNKKNSKGTLWHPGKFGWNLPEKLHHHVRKWTNIIARPIFSSITIATRIELGPCKRTCYDTDQISHTCGKEQRQSHKCAVNNWSVGGRPNPMLISDISSLSAKK